MTEIYLRVGSFHVIDPVCIDQTNDEEKSTQVAAMHRIYSCARRTLIWLGPSSEDTDMALDNLRKLTDEMGTPPFPDDQNGKELIQRRLAPRNHRVWRAIVTLYRLPWFSRVWILQEVVLSKGAYVLCGQRTVTWDTLVEFADAITVIWPAVLGNAGEDVTQENVSGFISCSQINRFRTDPVARRLFPLLTTTRERATSTPIDHIYGIAAMLPREQRAVININYGLEYVEAVLAFCKIYVENDPLLHLFGMAPSNGRHAGLPSWCPDFGFQSSEASILSTYMGFRAGFIDWNQRRSHIRMLEQPKYALSVPGFRVDVVRESVSNKSRKELAMQEAGETATAWESECRRLFEETCPKHAATADSEEAYARTLIAGHWNSTRPVLPDFELYKLLTAVRRYWGEVATRTPTNFGTYSVSKDEVLHFDVAVNLQEKRRFFSTENGRIGLGPTRVEAGDIVCVFDSGACLYVLRYGKESGKGEAKLIGEAYMHGFMDLKVTSKDRMADIGPHEDFIIV